jgi:hypothetical protein
VLLLVFQAQNDVADHHLAAQISGSAGRDAGHDDAALRVLGWE